MRSSHTLNTRNDAVNRINATQLHRLPGTSQANEAVFHDAVEDIEKIVRKMLKQLETNAPPRDREIVAAKARERAKLRFPERYATAD